MSKRTEFLPFALPDLGEAELREIREVLESGWLTTGPKVQRFEREFAEYVGARFAIAVNSCTAAMHLALEAVGVRAGDFVVTTPYTFAATAEVIRYFDAVPVFVDVEPDTFNISPSGLQDTLEDLQRWISTGAAPTLPAVRRVVTSTGSSGGGHRAQGSVKAVMPVHMAGQACDMDRVVATAQAHGLPIIEDAAHACGSSYQGRRIGAQLSPAVPSMACFSFYATKTLATGEGGMVTTDNERWAERIRTMSLHGISKDAWKRYTAEGSWYYEILAPGYKYNMPDLLAAVGLAQLSKVDTMRVRREAIAQRYDKAFSEFDAVELPTVRTGIGHAWHLYMLRLTDEGLSLGRDEFIRSLKQQNIGASVHFIPLHLHPYCRTTYGYESTDLPVAAREYGREISLPIYSKMTDADVQSVIEAVRSILQQHSRKASHATAGR